MCTRIVTLVIYLVKCQTGCHQTPLAGNVVQKVAMLYIGKTSKPCAMNAMTRQAMGCLELLYVSNSVVEYEKDVFPVYMEKENAACRWRKLQLKDPVLKQINIG